MTFLLMVVLGRPGCFAQVDPWERVKLIEPGKKVTITLSANKSISGRIQSWSPDGLVLIQGKDKVTHLAKTEIAKVALLAGMSRGRRALWAGLIGGGAGAGIFGGLCAGNYDCDASPAAVAAAGGIWVGGIAAGVAALIPQHKEVIYTAPALAAAGGSVSNTEQRRSSALTDEPPDRADADRRQTQSTGVRQGRPSETAVLPEGAAGAESANRH
jgi:hypothetical protein